MPELQRPDPDALLAQVQQQERKAHRGKMRLYFGASAGVGKTYAMLSAARKLLAAGTPLLVGVVETHGRDETAALLEGLPVLPLKQVAYRGKTIGEFDIDGALAAGVSLILVDELAHSNAPGSRHPKRWQDVEELLEAGIDVFTTVNVQHLESLNDVVGGITGVRVGETVPDTVFDMADEVVLVDIPADELLARLKAGRVYQVHQAERAAKNFFRKGNLIALRELALRRTADRVEGDVRAYRVEQSIDTIWKTGVSLLACVGPRDGGEHIVRSTARLASQLGARWHAVYVETPALQRLPASQRERILKTLKLAGELGAETAVLSGPDIARELADYARGHNLSKLVLGRPHPTWPWRRPHSKGIARYAPDVDTVEIGIPASAPSETRGPSPLDDEARPVRWDAYALGSAASLATGLLCWAVYPHLDLTNIAMLFLLTVFVVAIRLGHGPSVAATIISVLTFDYFFVPPQFTFAVSDLQYLVTFGVMLLVGLISGHLGAGVRFQARVAANRETRWRALYEFARELSGTLQTEQIFDITRDFVARAFRANAT
ncbi:MAG TPA: DUF4118 domain-containing protein, partial [Telluria sp.]|nr:DUF4118 domain-containing protein [Telluria sp.]